MALVASAVAGLAACADHADMAAPAETAAPALAVSLALPDTTISTFTVIPGTPTTAVFGDHKIKIPANAVCDPALSSYGPTEWDKSCQPLLAPLVISTKSWRSAAGHPLVEFEPALRFRPTDKGVVTLFLMDKVASADPSYTIFYCTHGKCVDESLNDPSVATQRDANNGFAYRQLKHFSGYVIGPSRTDAEVAAATFDAVPLDTAAAAAPAPAPF